MKKKIIIPIIVGLAIVALIIVFGQMFTVRQVNVEFVNGVSGATKQQILEIADIDTHTNIFTLDESAITQNIQNAFDDNAIKVNNIERSFPNKVTIKITERISIYKIAVENSEMQGYVAVDRNFQRTNVKTSEEIAGAVLTEVKGITVSNTYRTPECYFLRDLASAFIACGIEEEALPYFVKSINFSDSVATVKLLSSETEFIISLDDNNLKQTVERLYSEYINAGCADRVGAVFSA